MPLLVGAFIGALISAAGTILGQILISLGIGFVAYQGIDMFLIAAKQTFLGSLGLSPVITQLAGVLQVGSRKYSRKRYGFSFSSCWPYQWYAQKNGDSLNGDYFKYRCTRRWQNAAYYLRS
jgi:hypothetical protein